MNATIAIKLTDKSTLTVAPIQLFHKEMLNARRAKASACGRRPFKIGHSLWTRHCSWQAAVIWL